MSEKSFPFIVFNGPKLEDPGARRIIRKQAMKDVGNARKQRGRGNKKHHPVSGEIDVQIGRTVSSGSSRESSAPLELASPETSDSSNSTDATDYDEIVPRGVAPARRKVPVSELHSESPLTSMAISLFSNYETARAKFKVDVTELSILTDFHVGRGTISILAKDPTRLATLLGHQQWSYLEYVPCLYGSSRCLTAATNCVLGKVKGILSPHDQCKDVTLRLYTKALRTLQDAISSGSGCMDADVLCATQLLSLHELLDPTREEAWSHHVNGSARLIKHRTPERFTTEFDKALFAAHIGPIISQSFTESTHCYLEEPEWTSLYKSIIQDTDYLNERSALTINVRSLMFPICGLWCDTGEALNGLGLFDDFLLADLAARWRKSQRDILDWMEEYKAHCVRLSLASPPPSELTKRRELLGAALECLCIIKRLLASVYDDDREKLEEEAQAVAHLLFDLQRQPSLKHSWLFAPHEKGVAASILDTKEDWACQLAFDSDYDRKLACRARYHNWSKILRKYDA